MPGTNTCLGVISDTHGDAAVCRKIWNAYFKEVDMVLHAGDVFYHGPRNPLPGGYDPAALADLLNNSGIPVLLARGNCDADVDQGMLNYPLQSPYLITHLGGFKIMVRHGTEGDLSGMLKAARGYGVEILVFGHTHERMLDRKEGVVLLNPGSPSLPKGDGTPSMALLKNKRITVLNPESGAVLSELSL